MGGYIFYKEPKEYVDPVYIFPDRNLIVFGKDAKELIVKRIGVSNYKRISLVNAFASYYTNVSGSYIPEDIKF